MFSYNQTTIGYMGLRDQQNLIMNDRLIADGVFNEPK